MCNRYRQVKTPADLSRIFDARPLLDAPDPATELFPKRQGLVVRKEAGERVLDLMRWGFPPPPRGRAPVTNVRNLASPFWRAALKRPDRRCLVPVTSFCEWAGGAGAKQERWFSLPASEVFAFAGIWTMGAAPQPPATPGGRRESSKWRPTEEGQAFAFLTCEPNPLVAAIHPKAMPVILTPEDYDRWLDGEADDACSLAVPFPSQLMAVS